MKYNFDLPCSRRNSDATKYEELHEKYGRSDLLPLWIADMDFMVDPAITEELVRAMSEPVLGYTTAPASFWNSITSWLAHRHRWNVNREDVDFVPGVKKGIGLIINYFTKPGDKVLIQPPVYHSFKSVVEGNGRVVVTNPLVERGGSYSMDLDALDRIIDAERPVMMIVCNPHNPIGLQWSADTLARVASICYKYGVILLSDEIYADLVFDRSLRHIPTASVSPEAEKVTVTIGAPSKSFNIPGIASAWVAVKNPALRDGFFAWLKASEFDTPPIGAIYGTRAAYSKAEEWLDCMLDYLKDNCDFAIDYIAKNIPGVKSFRPDAGFGLWIDFRGLNLSHDKLTELLVDKAGIAVSDGASFGIEGSGLVRLNFGVPRATLTEGLDRIRKAVLAL